MLTMTKESEIHVSETLLTLKKGFSTLDEHLKKIKHLCDKLAAMKKPHDDVIKVFRLARGLGSRYQGFRTTMLSKPANPSFNQSVVVVKAHDEMLSSELEEENFVQINHAQAFYNQKGRNRGCGRQFLFSWKRFSLKANFKEIQASSKHQNQP